MTSLNGWNRSNTPILIEGVMNVVDDGLEVLPSTTALTMKV